MNSLGLCPCVTFFNIQVKNCIFCIFQICWWRVDPKLRYLSHLDPPPSNKVKPILILQSFMGTNSHLWNCFGSSICRSVYYNVHIFNQSLFNLTHHTKLFPKLQANGKHSMLVDFTIWLADVKTNIHWLLT